MNEEVKTNSWVPWTHILVHIFRPGKLRITPWIVSSKYLTNLSQQVSKGFKVKFSRADGTIVKFLAVLKTVLLADTMDTTK